MSASSKASFVRTALITGLLTGLSGFLSGCAESSLAHRDTVTSYAGSGIAAMTATQAVNPWPPISYNRNIDTSAERQGVAVQKVTSGESITKASSQTSEGSQTSEASVQ
jgi:hypothetical protein